jgi:hypothetical protein
MLGAPTRLVILIPEDLGMIFLFPLALHTSCPMTTTIHSHTNNTEQCLFKGNNYLLRYFKEKIKRKKEEGENKLFLIPIKMK